MTEKPYEQQLVPENMLEIQNKIIEQAKKQGYALSKIGALRIIANSYTQLEKEKI